MMDAVGESIPSAPHVQVTALVLGVCLALAIGVTCCVRAFGASRASGFRLSSVGQPLGTEDGRARTRRRVPGRDTLAIKGVAGRIRQWALWSQPRSAVTFFLTVDFVAIAATLAAMRAMPAVRDVAVAGTLTALGMLAVEMSRHRERLRRLPGPIPHVSLTSVWTMAAALSLPPALAATAAMVLYIHLGLRHWEHRHTVSVYRFVFRAAIVMLSCLAAASIAALLSLHERMALAEPAALFGVVAAIATYSTVHSGLVASERALRRTFLHRRSDIRLNHTILCVGALVAVLHATQPWLLPLSIPVVMLLHRSVVLPQLERAATRDGKTGLLNLSTWRRVVGRELEHAQRKRALLSVLMIDADHFKRVNDTYGHLAGDRVLHALASTIASKVHERAVVGRFGGEEFVVALPGTGEDAAAEAARSICESIRRLNIDDGRGHPVTGLSVSIGVTTFPHSGPSLDDLLQSADHAVFRAKSNGRDQVRTSRPEPATVPAPRTPDIPLTRAFKPAGLLAEPAVERSPASLAPARTGVGVD